MLESVSWGHDVLVIIYLSNINKSYVTTTQVRFWNDYTQLSNLFGLRSCFSLY